MRVLQWTASLLAMVMSFALQAQEDSKSAEANVAALPWLSHVKGYCWRSELTQGEVHDRQCFRVQFGRVVRADQQIANLVDPENTMLADSLYVWDPRSKKVRHIFWGSDGSFETSSGWIEGDALIFYLDRETAASGDASARTVLRKTGADTYQARRESREGSEWREQFSFVYRRAEPVR